MLFDAWVGYIYLYDEKSGKWLWDNYSIASDKLELNLWKNILRSLNPLFLCV